MCMSCVHVLCVYMCACLSVCLYVPVHVCLCVKFGEYSLSSDGSSQEGEGGGGIHFRGLQ